MGVGPSSAPEPALQLLNIWLRVPPRQEHCKGPAWGSYEVPFCGSPVRTTVCWSPMTEGRQPSVYVVAGPNGAGKSTFARLFLPEYADCREFVNADLIAAGLSPFNPESQAIQAGRLMLERIETLARQQVDFGFETTLAGRGWLPLLHKLREQGYRLNMFFLWLPSAELAISRVEERVRAGGHAVPEAVVRRRFVRGLRNFFEIYQPILDGWLVFDSSASEPLMIALSVNEHRFIFEKDRFDQIQQEER
jgi:predicted ABC-type ATPase